MNLHRQSQYVYFATKPGRDAIKIGVSIDPAFRCSTAGWRLIAQIPGCVSRERAVQWFLRKHRVDGEWFRSAPDVWRVVLEALDTGDLSWLPPSPDMSWDAGRSFNGEVAAEYGSRKLAADALGVCQTAFC